MNEVYRRPSRSDLGPCLRFAVLDFALGLVEHAAFIEPGIRAAICQMTSRYRRHATAR